MRRNLAALLGAIVLAIGLAVPAAAAGGGFAGRWVSTDFDGSSQLLIVSRGSTPSVVFEDFYASGCDRFGGPSTHWVAAGQGSFEGDDLWVEFHKSGCGTFGQGGYGDFWTYDAATDTLLDSVGIIWTRAT